MTKEELKKRLLKEKKAELIIEINYNLKKYIKAIKVTKDDIQHIYYEIENDQIKEVNDENILNFLKKNYDIKPSKIIY